MVNENKNVLYKKIHLVPISKTMSMQTVGCVQNSTMKQGRKGGGLIRIKLRRIKSAKGEGQILESR